MWPCERAHLRTSDVGTGAVMLPVLAFGRVRALLVTARRVGATARRTPRRADAAGDVFAADLVAGFALAVALGFAVVLALAAVRAFVVVLAFAVVLAGFAALATGAFAFAFAVAAFGRPRLADRAGRPRRARVAADVDDPNADSAVCNLPK